MDSILFAKQVFRYSCKCKFKCSLVKKSSLSQEAHSSYFQPLHVLHHCLTSFVSAVTRKISRNIDAQLHEQIWGYQLSINLLCGFCISLICTMIFCINWSLSVVQCGIMCVTAQIVVFFSPLSMDRSLMSYVITNI